MDQVTKLNNYRKILPQVLEYHAALPAEPTNAESIPICDPVHDNYLLMDIFPDPKGSAAHIVVHLRLKNGKVRVERDGIEDGIAQDLIKAGVAEKDIEYTFYGEDPEFFYESAAA
ncbi:MAG: element excision factor XisI family protein [Blastocatellia bacterium]